MSKQRVTKGATSQITYVFIRDSSSTTGAGLTGLAFNSGSLVASYVRPAGSRTAITLATQTTTGAYSSGGFVEVDATNMPGLYRLDVPDAVFATGVNSAIVMLKGATNMEPCVIEFELKGVDLQDSVRGGMTALPNAAAEAAGGLYTRGTGAGQINQPANGMADVNVVRNAGTAITAASGRQEVNVSHWAGSAVAAVTAAGVPKVDVSHNAGSTITASAGRQEVNVSHFGGTAGTFTGGRAEVNTTHAAGTAWNSGAISSLTLAADTLTAAKVAADVSTEIATGVWANATRTLSANTNLNDLSAAGVRSALGLASANLDTQLATIDTNVDDLKSGIIYGTAATGTLSTTVITTNLTGYANDQLIGRVVIFLTGNCAGEATDITDYVSTSGTLTVTALTTAPANGDAFKIV